MKRVNVTPSFRTDPILITKNTLPCKSVMALPVFLALPLHSTIRYSILCSSVPCCGNQNKDSVKPFQSKKRKEADRLDPRRKYGAASPCHVCVCTKTAKTPEANVNQVEDAQVREKQRDAVINNGDQASSHGGS